MSARARQLGVRTEEWPTKIPFRIAGLTRDRFRLVVVQLTDGTFVGQGEGLPVHYLSDTTERMCEQIEAAREAIEGGIDREALLSLLPPGGARNALDSALWDLEAKQSGKSIWDLTGIVPNPVTTTYTVGIEATPEEMAARAVEASSFPILKIKVDADCPVECVAAIRAARSDARLVVDANRSWTYRELREFAPRLAALDVQLIEQPLPREGDESLEGYRSPVPLSADESCQHRGELEAASRRYQILNIKLDKAGGLTEALLLAQAARQKRMQVLVSNMGGTSLSMAPAFVLAQLCDYVELDGPFVLRSDRLPALAYRDGHLEAPDPRLWG